MTLNAAHNNNNVNRAKELEELKAQYSNMTSWVGYNNFSGQERTKVMERIKVLEASPSYTQSTIVNNKASSASATGVSSTNSSELSTKLAQLKAQYSNMTSDIGHYHFSDQDCTAIKVQIQEVQALLKNEAIDFPFDHNANTDHTPEVSEMGAAYSGFGEYDK